MEKCKEEKRKGDIIIFTDSKNAVEDIQDYDLNVYKNIYVLEARKRYFKIIKDMRNVVII